MQAMLNCLSTIFLVAIVAVLTTGQQEQVSEICLGCICEGSTNCNVSTPCHVPFAGAYFCGPLLISYAYWTDAGKPVLANDNPEERGAFENCVLDLQCAALTVRNYMKKFAQDCNGDGAETCADYALIHKLGGYGCTGQISDTQYYRQFEECALAFNML